MNRINQHCKVFALSTILSWLCINFNNYSYANVLVEFSSTVFKEKSLIAQRNRGVNWVSPPLPPAKSLVGQTVGRAKHNSCESNGNPLRALVPSGEITSDQSWAWGKMTPDNPMIWFYIPYKTNVYGEFVLRDEKGNDVGDGGRKPFKLEISSGVIGYYLPQGIIDKLEQGKFYKWSFRIKCDSRDSPDEEVKGWIQWLQEDPILEQKIKSSTKLDRAAIYAESGIWYDALAEVGRLKYTSTNLDVDQSWKNLLQGASLSEMSEYPILKIYK